MSVNATIEVMTLSTLVGQEKAVVPTAALSRYFQALGVNLNFQQGATLDEDPSHDSAAMSKFCDDHAPANGSVDAAAILVVASQPPEGDGVNGQLMDPIRRGACAVYTDSWVFKTFGAEERFEVYVHELGHLFNLLHPPLDEDPKQAMSQFDARHRVTNRVQLWQDVIANAGPSYRSKLSAFFGSGANSPIGLPMSRDCCDLLVDRDASEVIPWGDPFGDDSRGASNDVAFARVNCKVTLESDQLQVAQPLDFSVSLRLSRGEKAGDIPAALDLRSGNVRIEVAGPEDKVRTLLPEAYTCGSMRRRLRPGQVARRHYSVVGDRRALALPEPGEYRLRAVLPSLGVQSDWVALSVQAAAEPLVPPAMQEFLRRGVPKKRGEQKNVVAEMLTWPQLPGSTRAYLNVVDMATRRDPPQTTRATRALASPRVAERDTLLRIAYWQRLGPGHEEEVHRAIDVAERLFAKCDLQHATLSYLRNLRKNEYARNAATRRNR